MKSNGGQTKGASLQAYDKVCVFAALLISYLPCDCYRFCRLLIFGVQVEIISVKLSYMSVLGVTARPSSPVRQDGERRTTFLDGYALRRVPFFSFWLIFLCAYL